MNGSSSSARVWLVASLALNLFMAGAIAAQFLAGRGPGFPHHSAHGPAHSMHPRVLRAVLPEQDQAVLEETLQKHRPTIRPRVKALREARRGVAEALRAEPFERRNLEAALATLRVREAEMAAAAQGMTAELASRVSPQARSKLAEQMKPRKHRWRDRREGGPGEDSERQN